MEAAEIAGSALAVWFIVGAIRSWLPGAITDWLSGPGRVWPVVYLAALVLTYAGNQDASIDGSFFISSLNLAIQAVGVDTVRTRVGIGGVR